MGRPKKKNGLIQFVQGGGRDVSRGTEGVSYKCLGGMAGRQGHDRGERVGETTFSSRGQKQVTILEGSSKLLDGGRKGGGKGGNFPLEGKFASEKGEGDLLLIRG